MNVRTSKSLVSLHGEHLLQLDVKAARVAERWRAVNRVALVALLAGSTLQLYLMHIYATIASLPTLAVGVQN